MEVLFFLGMLGFCFVGTVAAVVAVVAVVIRAASRPTTASPPRPPLRQQRSVWDFVKRPSADRYSVRTEPPDTSWLSRPKPGEIWWADIPFDDGQGSKDRPCLVVRTHAASVDVLYITSKSKVMAYRDFIEIPTASWDRKDQESSYLRLANPIRIGDRAFRRRAGRIDSPTWELVRSRHVTGWVTA
jgi:hypothetical protein